MKNKKLLTGNEAVAQGFYEGGGQIAGSYPGSPTVEIMEKIMTYDGIYGEFSTNEKVALELAIGGSFYGARSLASMKHVGVNIAADPLMTFTQTPINGGFILVTGDDPGMASSQNEQDNRIFGKFANMAILYPGSAQEAKDYTKLGLDLSEEFKIPVMLNITSRVCHSRGPVEINERIEKPASGFIRDQEKYTMLPPNTIKAQHFMKSRLEDLSERAYDLEINTLEEVNSDTLIITSGLMYYNVKELKPKASIYKLGLVYPLSEKRLKELAGSYKRIVVIEEMTGFIENELRLMGIDSYGKDYFSFTGELSLEDIEKGLYDLGLVEGFKTYTREEVVKRPPMFCSGCPHRPVFDLLKKMNLDVMGDIGCYSMAVLPAFEAAHTMISMGASLGISKGMVKARALNEDKKPLVSVIGDGTFFHSGLTGFINLLHNQDPEDNLTCIVLDNRTTAMTGGQDNASSGNYKNSGDMDVSIKEILGTMGFENVQEVDQFDYKNLKKVLEEETKRPGISIVITTRPCALRHRIKEEPFYVDPEVCISCRSCVKTNCPPIRMKKYEGIDKEKSYIDPSQCVGCSVCSQVCPVGAIKRD